MFGNNLRGVGEGDDSHSFEHEQTEREKRFEFPLKTFNAWKFSRKDN